MDIHSSGRIDVDEAEFCFVMSQAELATLSVTLERADETVAVVFSGGRLVFKTKTLSSTTPSSTFQVRQTGTRDIEICANPLELESLSRKLKDVAMSEVVPDYVAHVHLDQWYTEPPIGLSEVIIQRSDSFHP